MNFGVKVALTAVATALATVVYFESRRSGDRRGAVPALATVEPAGTYESRVWRPPDSMPPDTEPPEGSVPNGWVRIQFKRDGTFVTRWEDARTSTPRMGSFAGHWERRADDARGVFRLTTTLVADGAPPTGGDSVEIEVTRDGAVMAPGILVRQATWMRGTATRYDRVAGP